jgi:hypothetical protein
MGKRLRSGKTTASERILPWLASHRDYDPLLLFVDDFAASGDSLSRGLGNLLANASLERELTGYMEAGRVLFYVMHSFPEAKERLCEEFPEVRWFWANCFGEEVRALDPHSAIFEDESEIDFARDMLLQLGRELVPQHPLGWNDMAGLVVFYNTIPNNTLPVFWSGGTVNERPWKPLFPRA